MSPNDDKTICLTVQNLMLILYAEKKSSSVFHIFPLHRTSRMRKNNAFYPRLPSLFYCVLLHDVDSQLSYRTERQRKRLENLPRRCYALKA